MALPSPHWPQEVGTQFSKIMSECNSQTQATYFQKVKDAKADGAKHRELGSMWSELDVQHTSMAVQKNMYGHGFSMSAAEEGATRSGAQVYDLSQHKGDLWVYHSMTEAGHKEDHKWSYCEMVTANSFAETVASFLLKACLTTSTHISIFTFLLSEDAATTLPPPIYYLTVGPWVLALLLWVALAWFEVEAKVLQHGEEHVGDFGFRKDMTLQTKFALLLGEMLAVPEHIMKAPCTFHTRHMSRSFAVLKNGAGQRVWFLGFLSKEQQEFESCLFVMNQTYVVFVKGFAITAAQFFTAFWTEARLEGTCLRLSLALVCFAMDLWQLHRGRVLKVIVLKQLNEKIGYVKDLQKALEDGKSTEDSSKWFHATIPQQIEEGLIEWKLNAIKVDFTPDEFFQWKTYNDELRTLTNEVKKLNTKAETQEFIYYWLNLLKLSLCRSASARSQNDLKAPLTDPETKFVTVV